MKPRVPRLGLLFALAWGWFWVLESTQVFPGPASNASGWIEPSPRSPGPSSSVWQGASSGLMRAYPRTALFDAQEFDQACRNWGKTPEALSEEPELARWLRRHRLTRTYREASASSCLRGLLTRARTEPLPARLLGVARATGVGLPFEPFRAQFWLSHSRELGDPLAGFLLAGFLGAFAPEAPPKTPGVSPQDLPLAYPPARLLLGERLLEAPKTRERAGEVFLSLAQDGFVPGLLALIQAGPRLGLSSEQLAALEGRAQSLGARDPVFEKRTPELSDAMLRSWFRLTPTTRPWAEHAFLGELRRRSRAEEAPVAFSDLPFAKGLQGLLPRVRGAIPGPQFAFLVGSVRERFLERGEVLPPPQGAAPSRVPGP